VGFGFKHLTDVSLPQFLGSKSAGFPFVFNLAEQIPE
jgi:hypothetical protein